MTITFGEPAVTGMTWDAFLAGMARRWKPGQHIAMIGPTGEGKTTFAAGLISLRKWVMALDPKGEDETLAASGFERVMRLPSEIDWTEYLFRSAAARQWNDIHQRIAEGKPARIIIGGPARTEEQDNRNQDLMRRAFSYAREAGGWTVYVDEFELISSQRMFKLGPQVERMLISARRDGTSVLTSFQAAAWVSKHATRQARYTVIWPTGDRQMIKNVAESMGRDWHVLAQAVDELPAFHVLVIPRGKSGGPLICTSAPRL
jgi:energy-coupling factor transporter ATP-binding protein EcfA2